VNSAYCIFKRPALIAKDQPFRKSDKSMTGVYVAQKHYSANIPQETNLAAFPRRINVDRVSISGLPCHKSRAKWLPIALVANNIAPVTMQETATWLSVGRSSNADSYSRCFRYKRLIRQHAWSTAVQVRRHVSFSSFPEGDCPNNLGRFISSRVDRSQLRMSEDSNLMCNQTQALSTPDNLVGGALTCEPYLPLVGLKPPCKGGNYGI